MVAGDIPGRTQTAVAGDLRRRQRRRRRRPATLSLLIAAVSIAALAGRPAAAPRPAVGALSAAGARAVEPASRRVHPGLQLDVAIRARRRVRRPVRAVGGGQVDDPAADRRAGPARPGSVRLGGTTLFDSASAGRRPACGRRRIGLIFQDDLLFPHLSVAGNVRFGLKGLAAGRGRRAGWPRSPSSAGSGTCSPARRRRSRAASGSGSAWPGRWPPGRGSCSATSRSRRSTWRAAHALIDRLKAVQRGRGDPGPLRHPQPGRGGRAGDAALPALGRRIVDEGPPLDVLAAGRPGAPGGGPQRLRGDGRGRTPTAAAETLLRLAGGPALVVPSMARPLGSPLSPGRPGRRHPAGPRADRRPQRPQRDRRDGRAGRPPRRRGRGARPDRRRSSGSSASSPRPSRRSGWPRRAEVRLIIKARSCRVLEPR